MEAHHEDYLDDKAAAEYIASLYHEAEAREDESLGVILPYSKVDSILGVAGINDPLRRNVERAKTIGRVNTLLKRGMVVEDQVYHLGILCRTKDYEGLGEIEVIELPLDPIRQILRYERKVTSLFNRCLSDTAEDSGQIQYVNADGTQVSLRGERALQAKRNAQLPYRAQLQFMHEQLAVLATSSIRTLRGIRKFVQARHKEVEERLRLTHASDD